MSHILRGRRASSPRCIAGAVQVLEHLRGEFDHCRHLVMGVEQIGASRRSGTNTPMEKGVQCCAEFFCGLWRGRGKTNPSHTMLKNKTNVAWWVRPVVPDGRNTAHHCGPTRNSKQRVATRTRPEILRASMTLPMRSRKPRSAQLCRSTATPGNQGRSDMRRTTRQTTLPPSRRPKRSTHALLRRNGRHSTREPSRPAPPVCKHGTLALHRNAA